MDNEKKYTLTVTESQLKLIAFCVEDCHRFASGQCEMTHTVSTLDNYIDAEKALRSIKHIITPELSENESYGWSGSHCKNKYQRKFIAQTYCIYREIVHRMTVLNPPKTYSVYESETLTCEEGGNLPIIKEI